MGSPSCDGLASGPWSFLAAFSRSVSPPALLLPFWCEGAVDCDAGDDDWAPASSGVGILLLASAFRLIGSPSRDGFALGPWRALVAFSRSFSPWPEVCEESFVLSSRSDSVGVRSRRGFLLDAMVMGGRWLVLNEISKTVCRLERKLTKTFQTVECKGRLY